MLHLQLRLRLFLGLAALASSVLLTSVVLTPAANASLVLALDLPTMVSRADHVAVVDVVSVKSAWDARHERILTTVDLVVVENWKGSAGAATHLSVVQRGGTVDDTEMVVYGMPRFVAGERTLVFLAGRAEHANVVGMAQGKRAMTRDAATGRWFVHAPDRAGATFVRPPSAPGASPSAAPSPVFEVHPRPIDELRAEVKTLAAASGKSP
jgi:hypothetical protein